MDFSTALRSLRRRPAFAVTAVSALALGVAVNAAVLALLHGVAWQRLPFAEPEALAVLELDVRPPIFSKREFLFLRQETESLVDIAARGSATGAVLVGRGRPESIAVGSITSNLLALTGLDPVEGRAFDAGDAQGPTDVVLIAESFWRRAFAGDPEIVGERIALSTRSGRQSHTVVGVVPDAIDLLVGTRIHVWRPVDLTSNLASRAASLKLVGRRPDGVAWSAVQAEFSTLLERMAPVTRPRSQTRLEGDVVPLPDYIIGSRANSLYLLLGAAALVLLMSCANVATLFVTQALSRESEFAVRIALGASRVRLVRLMLAEGLMVGVVAAAVGLLLAGWTIDAIAAGFPSDIPRITDVRLAPAVVAASVAITLGVGTLVGVFPLAAMRHRIDGPALASAAGRARGSRPRRRTQEVLLIGQIGLALVLLAATGAMVRTVQNLLAQDAGIDAAGVSAIDVEAQFPSASETSLFLEQVLTRVRGAPGVEGAAATYHLPLSGSNSITTVRLPNHPAVSGDESQTVGFQLVTPSYFRVMQMPLVAGRTFSANPDQARREIVVSEAFANQYWPGENAVGRAVLASGERRIVGVVGDTRHRGLALPARPEAYFPLSSFNRAGLSIVVRSALPAEAVARTVRAGVSEFGPDVPVTGVASMQDVIERSLGDRLRSLQLLELFTVLALSLGAIGVYGVMAHLVNHRRRELGIRLALGATPGRIVAMVLRRSLGLGAAGIGLGLIASTATGSLLAAHLFGVSHLDPATLGAASLVLALLAIAAATRPAVRAGRISPTEAIRED